MILRFLKALIKYLFLFLLIIMMVGIAGGFGLGLYYYLEVTKDLPKIAGISDYRPMAVTQLFSEDNELIAEAWDERRHPVGLDQIPKIVRQAFLAAEDANFYNHPGIDLTSIVRAIWVNFQHKSSKQGASTITQQIVKSLLLTREKTYTRKIREAILAYRLERALSKDEIFEIYLNQIYLGATSHGVKAAAEVYFHKSLDDLNIAEAAFLGGLPQKPSYLAKPEHREEAIRRQHYVLGQMYRNNMINLAQKEEALAFQLEIHDPIVDKIFKAPYFASFALKELDEILARLGDGLSAANPGGYKVYTTGSVEYYDIAQKAVRENLRNLDKRRGWRGPINVEQEAAPTADSLAGNLIGEVGILADEIYPARVAEVLRGQNALQVQLGDFEGVVSLASSAWAKRFLDKKGGIRWIKPIDILRAGDVIEVSLDTNKAKAQSFSDIAKQVPLLLDQSPEVQGAFVVASALTGEVKVVIGGYDYQKSQFNRATQGRLQPGSGFKPFIYLGAIDYLDYTPATIVPDSPISMVAGDGNLWEPQNYDKRFIGPITMRTALERSRNVVSVYILQQLGVDRGISIARRFGISTPIGRNMSISLGTAEVRPIELVRAYGVFAAGGWLAEPLVIKRIEDRGGNMIYEQRPRQKRVIEEDSAFIMANMMKGVVDRGTARSVSVLKRPIAGKTGTTNDQMDAWFIGYTPEWVAGGWVGFDVKKTLGDKETGGRAAAPMFVEFMKEFLEDKEIIDFEIPDGVIPVWVSKTTGHLTEPGEPDAFFEYFKSGTEPVTTSASSNLKKQYLSSDEF
jgi:penicillin-binding protein 1A